MYRYHNLGTGSSGVLYQSIGGGGGGGGRVGSRVGSRALKRAWYSCKTSI